MSVDTCPNSDPAFVPTFARLLGHEATPEDRRKLYYSVCVVVRIVVLYVVAKNHKNAIVQTLAGIAGLITMLRLAPSLRTPGRQWFSKRFQWFIGLCLVVSSTLAIAQKSPTWITPVVFFASILGGILQSLWVPFC